MYFFIIKSVAMTVYYIEQDVNFIWQSRKGLKNFQNEPENL